MRNILLVVVDSLRADHLGCYGYGRPTSGCLDALARRGAVLDACWSASNFTAPAFTSLFTGLYPHQHGVFVFTRKVGTSPVATALAAASVRMAGVVTFSFFEHLLADIWGPIEVVTQGRSSDYNKALPRAVTAGAVEWLERHGQDGPFCLFLHYDGPHAPYRLPDEFADVFDTVDAGRVPALVRRAMFPQDIENLGSLYDKPQQEMMRLIRDVNLRRRRLSADTIRWLIDKYDASVLYNDRVIGDLMEELRRLGLDEDTVVCVISDHGEEFLDHGNFTHGQVGLYEEVVRTAGIVVDPDGSLAGRRITSPVSHMGIMPTLLQLAGVPLPEPVAARSFAPLLRGEIPDDPTAAPPVFCQGVFKAAVRQGREKLIAVRPAPNLSRQERLRKHVRMLMLGKHGDELYDLTSDPHEKRNLARDRARVGRLRGLIEAVFTQALDAGVAAGQEADADLREKIEREMKDLGYM